MTEQQRQARQVVQWRYNHSEKGRTRNARYREANRWRLAAKQRSYYRNKFIYSLPWRLHSGIPTEDYVRRMTR